VADGRGNHLLQYPELCQGRLDLQPPAAGIGDALAPGTHAQVLLRARAGTLGLARAFLEAGADAVVTTLWPVDDSAAVDLMRSFYRRMGAGQGPALALLDADDADHRRAAAVAIDLASERRPSFITNYIEVEAHALLLAKLGRTLAREWLLGAALPVLRATPAEEGQARALIARHADKDWSFCDAISCSLMQARRVPTAFSFDRRFRQVGRFVVLGPS
jgi:predicted nucleic acid-binding protein